MPSDDIIAATADLLAKKAPQLTIETVKAILYSRKYSKFQSSETRKIEIVKLAAQINGDLNG